MNLNWLIHDDISNKKHDKIYWIGFGVVKIGSSVVITLSDKELSESYHHLLNIRFVITGFHYHLNPRVIDDTRRIPFAAFIYKGVEYRFNTKHLMVISHLKDSE